MVLVTSDDRPRVPRVGPKVFADVPSAAEVQGLKRSRSQFFLLCVFLLGLLVAVSAVAYVFWTQDSPDNSQLEEVQGKLDDATIRIGELERVYREDMSAFGDIPDLRKEVKDVADQIGERLRRVPNAAENLPPRSVYRDFIATGGAWQRQTVSAQEALRRERQSLDAEWLAVQRYVERPRPGPVSTPTPVQRPVP